MITVQTFSYKPPFLSQLVLRLFFCSFGQRGKTADWLFISRVLALPADQSKAAQVN